MKYTIIKVKNADRKAKPIDRVKMHGNQHNRAHLTRSTASKLLTKGMTSNHLIKKIIKKNSANGIARNQ